MFGISGLDPVVHAVFWSLLLNTIALVTVSFQSFPRPIERLQSAQFVNIFDQAPKTSSIVEGGAVQAEDLLVMAQRIFGASEAQTMFQEAALSQGREGFLPDATPEFIQQFERELAGSVGAATAHAMLGQIITGNRVSVEDLMKVADEAAQILEYSNQLETKSAELERALRQLRDVNEKLTAVSHQKDAFLSQVSHELRTPMTSIRSFSEILMDKGDVETNDRTRYSEIINNEALRLTRLLDELLDLSVLESGRVKLNMMETSVSDIIQHAIETSQSSNSGRVLKIDYTKPQTDVIVVTDRDRLAQVLINLITNAIKYCDAENPKLIIALRVGDEAVEIDVVDNGTGIPQSGQSIIFEKFSRLSDQAKAGSAGLGLAICREIMLNLGGSISYLPGQSGAAFRIRFPRQPL